MTKRNKPITVKAVYRPRLACYVLISRGKIIHRVKDHTGVEAFMRGWKGNG